MRVYYIKFRKFQDYYYKQNFYSILCSQKALNSYFEVLINADYKARPSSFIIGFFCYKKIIIRCRSPPSINSKKTNWLEENGMVNRPKRRKSNDNPYMLKVINNTYFIIFKDINNKNNEVQVSKEIYEAMDRFELDDLKELNEYDRHIEHSELTDNKLNTRIMNKPLSVEDSVIRKSSYENLMIAINLLPEIQKRRIKKYYFDEKTLKEIAKEEHCTHRAVKFSLDIAIKKLKEILKN